MLGGKLAEDVATWSSGPVPKADSDATAITTSVASDNSSVCAAFAIPEYENTPFDTASPLNVAVATTFTSVAGDAAIAEMCVGATFTILDALSVVAPATCVAAADPVVVATAKATVAVLLYPAGAITVNGASATNDVGQSLGNTDAP